MSTPLERAAAAIRRDLQDYITGFNETDWEQFSHDLADSVIGAAQLPDRYDTATELRIANLLQAAMYPTHLGVDMANERRHNAMAQALKMLGLLD